MSKRQPHPQSRNWPVIIGLVLLGLVALAVISYVFFPALVWTEQRDAGQEVVEQEIDAEQAVQEYEWFRTQYHEIEAQRAQIENAYEEEETFHETYGDDPDDWSREAETRHGRIHDRIRGYQNQLEQLVADYNARSDMANREMFKCHLPYQVDERFAITGPPGSDAPDQPQDEYVDEANPDQEPPEPEACDGLPDDVSSDLNSQHHHQRPGVASVAAAVDAATPTRVGQSAFTPTPTPTPIQTHA